VWDGRIRTARGVRDEFKLSMLVGLEGSKSGICCKYSLVKRCPLPIFSLVGVFREDIWFSALLATLACQPPYFAFSVHGSLL